MCGTDSVNVYTGVKPNLPWDKLISKFKKKVMNEEEPEEIKREREIDKKRKDTENAISKSISQVNILDLPEPPKNDNFMAINPKPMTAGFLTSRNRNPNHLSTEVISNVKMRPMTKGDNKIFSPEPRDKFFDKRVSTGTKATRYTVSRSSKRK